MRRWGVEQVFDPAQPGDPGGMYPELVQQVDGQCQRHNTGRKAQPDQRDEKHSRTRQPTQNANPVSGGQGQFLGRMVHRMVAPKPAHTVRSAVVPVITKFLSHKQQQHGLPRVQRHGRQPVVPGQVNQRGNDRQGKKHRYQVAAHQIEQRDPRCFPVITAAARQDDSLQQRARNNRR